MWAADGLCPISGELLQSSFVMNKLTHGFDAWSVGPFSSSSSAILCLALPLSFPNIPAILLHHRPFSRFPFFTRRHLHFPFFCPPLPRPNVAPDNCNLSGIQCSRTANKLNTSGTMMRIWNVLCVGNKFSIIFELRRKAPIPANLFSL